MKKVLIGIICGLIIGGIIFAVINQSKKDTGSKSEPSKSSVESKQKESKAEKDSSESAEKEETNEGYEILVSKKELTIEEGSTESFEITFTNPDEMSIREYIHCDDQGKTVEVRYTPLENKKTTVEVEGLKAGKTQLLISDYEYPNYKIFVNINVIEKN